METVPATVAPLAGETIVTVEVCAREAVVVKAVRSKVKVTAQKYLTRTLPKTNSPFQPFVAKTENLFRSSRYWHLQVEHGSCQTTPRALRPIARMKSQPVRAKWSLRRLREAHVFRFVHVRRLPTR